MTSNIRSQPGRHWGQWRRDIAHSYPNRSLQVHGSRVYEGNSTYPMPVEKSDHFILALKLGNAGEAKKMTG